MRLHVLDDLHLEFGKMRRYVPPPCDAVILAGDIATGVAGVMWAADTYDVPVLYVPGNHEYYGKRVYDKHLGRLRAKAEGTNVTVLNDQALHLGGVEFIGATLWTDFDLHGNAPTARLIAQQKMNDYEQIMIRDCLPMRPEDTAALHARSMSFLRATLHRVEDAPALWPQVVITHHAPSEISSLAIYAADPLTACYASRLEEFILDRAPALWVHGHMHNSSDYVIGQTRVVCNPRGYAPFDLNPAFDPQLIVEI